jgi:hypothetical protein
VTLRSLLYALARLLGDVNAVRRGTVGKKDRSTPGGQGDGTRALEIVQVTVVSLVQARVGTEPATLSPLSSVVAGGVAVTIPVTNGSVFGGCWLTERGRRHRA